MFRLPTASRLCCARGFSLTARGFSLMEVAIATAILALVLVALIGLLPSGATTFNKAMDTSISAQIAQRILHDAEQAEFDALIDKTNLPVIDGAVPEYFTFRAPRVREPQWRYYDVQGTEVLPKTPAALSEDERRAIVYYVNIRVMPRAAMPTTNESTAHVAQLTVQVARNPEHRTLPFVDADPSDPNQPERNLIPAGRGVPVYTYAALVGKNLGK
jgi:uncharacterized protein (TIGR02598 family)